MNRPIPRIPRIDAVANRHVGKLPVFAFPTIRAPRLDRRTRSLSPGRVGKATRVLSAWALLILLMPFAINVSAQVGYVHAMSGTAFIEQTLERTALNIGDTFPAGTSFATGAGGRLILKFADGQVLVLGPESVLRVDGYRFDVRNARASGITLGLVNGSMRFVAGTIASQNRKAVRIGAGASSITLLSDKNTDFTVVVDTEAAGGEVGVAVVASGEIAVSTPYGPIRRIAADQAAPWRANRGEPPPPVPLAAASAVIQATVAGLRVAALPPSTPVAVDIAASAVRSKAVIAAAATGPAGYVYSVSGFLWAGRQLDRTLLKAGDSFEAGTVFEVGENGHAVLMFADGQRVLLGQNSTARIESYRFDPGDLPGSGLSIALLTGELRFVGGTIASENPKAAQISAGIWPVSIVGTGGVDFTIVVNSSLPKMFGVAVVTAGEIAVREVTGSISLNTTSPAAYLGAWEAFGTPASLAAGFALMQGVVALQGLTLPTRAPVVVRSAANAARALAVASEIQADAAANPGNVQLAAAARKAALDAAAAAQLASADAQALAAGPLDSALAALPVPAAGLPEDTPTQSVIVPAVGLPPFPGTTFVSTLTPALTICRGSPC